MNTLIFGVQGSGKSTVGKYMAERLGIPYVATGDIFRTLREENSTLGKLVRKRIDQGELVPDGPTMEIVNQRLEESDTQNGFILDGAPRNLSQLKMFKSSVDLIVLVDLGEQEAVKRLLNRARHDDTKGNIKKRLSWYTNQTKPVVDFFRDKKVKIIEVDNTPTEEKVREDVDEHIKEFKRN